MSDAHRSGPSALAPSHSDERTRRSQRKEAKLRVAMWLNVAIVGIQIVFGIIAHSLGLIADAGINLTDFPAVLASMIAAH